MKMLALIAAAALAVTACAPVTEEEVSDAPEVDTGPAVSLGRIRDEAAFLSLVAGQELVGQGGSLRINADGTYSGTDAGLPVSGTWEWRAPYGVPRPWRQRPSASPGTASPPVSAASAIRAWAAGRITVFSKKKF